MLRIHIKGFEEDCIRNVTGYFNFNKKKDSKEYRDYQLLHKEKKSNPHPERSCESLSLFLQTRNQPANLHPSTPSLSPYDIAKPMKSSPDKIDSSKRKHKRYKTTPLTRADSAFTQSPLQVSFFSPTFTLPYILNFFILDIIFLASSSSFSEST